MTSKSCNSKSGLIFSIFIGVGWFWKLNQCMFGVFWQPFYIGKGKTNQENNVGNSSKIKVQAMYAKHIQKYWHMVAKKSKLTIKATPSGPKERPKATPSEPKRVQNLIDFGQKASRRQHKLNKNNDQE